MICLDSFLFTFPVCFRIILEILNRYNVHINVIFEIKTNNWYHSMLINQDNALNWICLLMVVGGFCMNMYDDIFFMLL